MNSIFKRHISFWKDSEIRIHFLVSILLLILSIILFYFAKLQTNEYAGNVVPDIFLDNLPVFNVGIIFFQGAFLFIVFLTGLLMTYPEYIPFTLENSALFLLIRSLFINMTHLSAPNVEYYRYIEKTHHAKNVVFTLTSGNDLFFSGHAGFPFLMALVFWQKRRVRLFLLLCSCIGAGAVILGHLHYTIDVFSAYFISFGIFEITKRLCKKEFLITQTI